MGGLAILRTLNGLVRYRTEGRLRGKPKKTMAWWGFARKRSYGNGCQRLDVVHLGFYTDPVSTLS